MAENVIKALEFLRIVDAHDGKVSLTNVAVMVVVLKILFVPQFSIGEVGALLIALLNYSAKKVIHSKSTPPIESSLETQVKDLESQVSKLNLANGVKKLT